MNRGALLLIASAIVHCSDDGVGPDAGEAQDAAMDRGVDQLVGDPLLYDPCGGDVSGTWDLEEGCVADNLFLRTFREVCPDAALLVVRSVEVGGAVTFSGREYSWAATFRLSYDIDVPTECLRGFGGCAG